MNVDTSGQRAPRGRGAAPRTWFRRRPPIQTRDALEQDFVTMGMAAVAGVFLPVVLAVAAVAYAIARVTRVSWRWVAGAAAGTGVVLVIVPGLADVIAGYVRPYRDVRDALVGGSFQRVAELPWLRLAAGQLGIALPVGLVVAAGTRLRRELLEPAWRERPVKALPPRVLEERVAAVARGDHELEHGVVIGVNERAEVVALTDEEQTNHAVAVGATGSGKTTTLVRIAHGNIRRGIGVVAVNLKGDAGFRDRLAELAQRYGRAFYEVSIRDGNCRWNPLRRGDASNRADKLVATEVWSEAHYKRAAERYAQLAFQVLDELEPDRAASLGRIVELLNPAVMKRIVQNELAAGPLQDRMRLYLDGLDGGQKSAVFGLGTRLAVLAESSIGPYLEPPQVGCLREGEAPAWELDLYEAIEAGAVVVFSLDSNAYPEKAKQVATLAVQDLNAVASLRLKKPAVQRGLAMVLVDEVSALDGTHLLALLARGRDARMATYLGTQALADFARMGDGFAEQVMNNAGATIIHRQRFTDSIESLAGLGGTDQVWEETMQVEHDSGVLGVGRGAATGVGSLRQVDRFRIHPNEIRALPDGQCVVIRKPMRIDRVRVVPVMPA